MLDQRRPGSTRGRSLGYRVGKDDGAASTRIHDVFDADGDASTNDLLHGEWMYDLGSVEGQFGGFRWRHGGYQARGGHLAWIGGEDAVHFFPYLELLRIDTDGSQSSAEICIASSDGAQ